jgi:hypothetical protein
MRKREGVDFTSSVSRGARPEHTAAEDSGYVPDFLKQIRNASFTCM